MKKRQYATIALGGGVALLVLFVLGMLYANSVEVSENSPAPVKFFKGINNAIFQKNNEVAAVVNDETITMEELDTLYDRLPEDSKQFTTKSDVLESLIDERVLLQEAEKRGYTVSEEEVDQTLNRILELNSLTVEQYSGMLESVGSSLEEARNYYRKSLMLNKLLNETVYSRVQVTAIEIRDYYLETVKPVSNATYEEAYDLINETLTADQQSELFFEYLDEVKNNSNIIIFYKEE